MKERTNEELANIVQKAANETAQNKGPGQVNGHKQGLTIVKIVNPNAPSKIHGQSS